MNIDDKIQAAGIALKAFNSAEVLIDCYIRKTLQTEQGKAFKAIVLSRLATVCLNCSDDLLGISTAGAEQEITNYLADYPVKYGNETLLLTGNVRYVYVGLKGKKHYKRFSVMKWKWEDEKWEKHFQGSTDIDLSIASDLAVYELNQNQNKLYA